MPKLILNIIEKKNNILNSTSEIYLFMLLIDFNKDPLEQLKKQMIFKENYTKIKSNQTYFMFESVFTEGISRYKLITFNSSIHSAYTDLAFENISELLSNGELINFGLSNQVLDDIDAINMINRITIKTLKENIKDYDIEYIKEKLKSMNLDEVFKILYQENKETLKYKEALRMASLLIYLIKDKKYYSFVKDISEKDFKNVFIRAKFS